MEWSEEKEEEEDDDDDTGRAGIAQKQSRTQPDSLASALLNSLISVLVRQMPQRGAPVCSREFVRGCRADQSDCAPCVPAGRSVIAQRGSTLLGGHRLCHDALRV
eukprot:5313-Pyramimonas_sp.AAC.1